MKKRERKEKRTNEKRNYGRQGVKNSLFQSVVVEDDKKFKNATKKMIEKN